MPDNPNEAPDPQLTQPELIGTDMALPKPARAPGITFIFLTIMLDMLALGMIAPVLPRLIESFLHGDTSHAAKMLGIFGSVFAVMQFFCSPILGSLSDRFGRRPVVLLSNFGLFADYVLMAWAPALPWLFVGRIISGVTASSVPTAMAYMADVTPPEKRAASFGMLNAAFGLGFVLGPALGGVLGDHNPRLPFIVAACLSFANGMYGLFVLPESLKQDHRSPFSWKRANPIGSAKMLVGSKALIALSGLLLLGYIAQQSLMNVYVIYTDYRYHWSPRATGLSLGVIGVFQIIYGLFLVKRATAKLGARWCIAFGLTGGIAGYICTGMSRSGLLLLLGIPLMNLMSLAWPNAQAAMSAGTSKSEQGQLQGAINSLRGTAGIIGPGLFTGVFAWAILPGRLFHTPGMPFFVAGVLLLLAIPLGFYATRKPAEVVQAS